MARRSTTGSKGSKAKARKARVLKASKAAKDKRPIGPASANRSRPSVAELKRQLEHRTREADELRQQQAASADVLKVISRSSFDLQVVFDTLLKSAAQLCQADHSFIYLREGDGYCCVSGSGDIPEWIEFLKQQTILAGRGTVAARAVLEGHTVHIPDVLADPEYTFNEAQKRGGYRTALGVPLLREGTTIGAMVLTRPTVRPFDANQIALVNTFADQAVIAIENARLFDEVQAKTRDLQEALTSQTGSAKILKVIASSPTDVGPVLNAIVESACELCEAQDAVLRLRDGENLCVRAHHGPIPTVRERWPIDQNWTAGRSVLDRKPIHVGDMLSPEGDEFPEGRRPGATRGLRTILSVPLLREGEPIGAITLRRTEVHPFSDKQITLLQTFADQAVIAIGNVRLFEEVQTKTRDLEESLQQQTATSEVLEVINASPGELAPVFDSMLEKAMRLCRAAFGGLWVFEGDRYVAVALRNVPAGYAKYLSRTTAVPGPHTAPYRFREGERSAIQNIDLAAEEPYRAGDPQRRALVDLGGARTALQVPLLRDEVVLGVITIYRQEVRPFSDKQLELLQNFAAQAVIAIENARLFNETKEALAQQIATSNVLRVISTSVADTAPVFEKILDSCEKLFATEQLGIFLVQPDGQVHAAAWRGAALQAVIETLPKPVEQTATGIVIRTRGVLHVPSTAAAKDLPRTVRDLSNQIGDFSMAWAPMLGEERGVGSIAVMRQPPNPFSEKELALLKTFADQAVIAIQNTRLFNETREALERETATADVLKVISRSAFDLQPVLKTLVESAARLCGADNAFVYQRDASVFRLAATFGFASDYEDFMKQRPVQPGRGTLIGRTTLEANIVHIPDALNDPEYTWQESQARGGYRTMLGVPMLRDGLPIGVFAMTRSTVKPFTDKQIAVLQTFADQAVIAIENLRLFNETKEALERQTATSDILRVIAGSKSDVQPVFEAILSRALHLCEAAFGFLTTYNGERFAFAAQLGVPPGLAEHFKAGMDEPRPGDAHWRLVNGEHLIHNLDQKDEEAYRAGNPLRRAVVDLGGARSALVVALRKSESLRGSITIYRKEVRPFSESQVALLRHFADQAVIAIENARLFNEVQAKTADLSESLQQQTATADVLKVISRSTFDLQTVLDTLLRSAARLCDADQGTITKRKDESFYRAVAYGYPEAFMEYAKDLPVELDRHTGTGRALLEGKVIHIPDVDADPEYTWKQARQLGGFRTMLGVPMLREGVPVGVLTLTRADVRPFTEKQIELVATFADQAAIAIENVRLFESVEARTRELAKSLENLQNAQDRLVQTEKLASLGQLTAGIAHEIKNPLNFVNNFSSLSTELVDELEETLAPAPLDQKMRGDVGELTQMLKSNLQKVVQHGKRADSIVKNMLLHSREGSGEHRSAEINAIVEDSLNLAYHGARAERSDFAITLRHDLDPNAGALELYPQEITRALLNLISNGFYAATRRKVESGNEGFEPVLSASTRNLGTTVEIRIRDNGTGIPPEVRENIFVPFFTTKPTGEGTGLGLSMTHDIIVKQHGGQIAVETEPGAFTEFIITLQRDKGIVGQKPQ